MVKTAEFVTLLDRVERLPGVAQLRTASYDLLAVGASGTVVDVGCGAGRAVAELAERGVSAVGVDVDEKMLAVARGRFPDLDFRHGSAQELCLADGSMDGYRAERVYHALPDPAAALREARRVLRPGGRIVLIGQDWELWGVDSDDPTLTRTVVQAQADAIPSPRCARRYRALLLDAGFTEVTVEVRTAVFTDRTPVAAMLSSAADASAHAGKASRADVDAWLAEQDARARADRFLAVVPVFVAAATRPDKTRVAH